MQDGAGEDETLLGTSGFLQTHVARISFCPFMNMRNERRSLKRAACFTYELRQETV